MKLVVAVICLFVVAASAQTTTTQRRADGHMTPLMVYGEAMHGSACSPVAVLSHGAGGSERGLGYLAQGLAQNGYEAIVMGHRESGMEALMADARDVANPRSGLKTLVMTASAYDARLMDVGAALDWATQHCTAHAGIPFKVLLGHSMGGITVNLEAGAKDIIGINPKLTGQDRFDAYVALSSEGPGKVFAEQAWAGIHKPVFVLTGTLDGSLNGGWETRKVAYDRLPASTNNCHWLGVVDGATHSDMGGRGPDAAMVAADVVPAVVAFLDGVKAGHCVVPTAVQGFHVSSK